MIHEPPDGQEVTIYPRPTQPTNLTLYLMAVHAKVTNQPASAFVRDDVFTATQKLNQALDGVLQAASAERLRQHN